MHKIWFNGEGYPDVDAMPPEVRRRYEAVLQKKRDSDPTLPAGSVRMGVWEDDEDGLLEVHTSREIIVNGKTYSDFDQLPPDKREVVRRMLGRFPDLVDEFGNFDGSFDGDLGLRKLEPPTSRRGHGEEDPEFRQFVLEAKATRGLTPFREQNGGPASYLKNGWAVAFILAVALLWVLVVRG
ncbi:MAG: hypothetical protein KJN92_00410 [Gemmatimonadetes bacterium]|nr:hypothetical protein [Gemmatimonadota bacterium]